MEEKTGISESTVSVSECEIVDWVRSSLASMLNASPSEIDPDERLGTYGLDSVEAVSLAAELSDWVGVLITTTDLWDHNTINALANYTFERIASERA
jgi:acyl carrier protein